MNFHRLITRTVSASLGLALGVCSAADPAPLSASALAARLSALQQDGSSYVRLRMEVQHPGTEKVTLQLQIKQRRTKSATEVLYQVLWPKERKGEAILLRKSASRPASGSLFLPPDTVRPLDSSQLNEPLFGSDLSYNDVLENFFTWEHQAIVGTELVDRVPCQILESKPGKGQQSVYGSVRTWVDSRRFIPLRVEKYLPSERLARRIDTTKVANDDRGMPTPANLSVESRKDFRTELDGSRIKHDVRYEDRDFSPEGLNNMNLPHSSSE